MRPQAANNGLECPWIDGCYTDKVASSKCRLGRRVRFNIFTRQVQISKRGEWFVALTGPAPHGVPNYARGPWRRIRHRLLNNLAPSTAFHFSSREQSIPHRDCISRHEVALHPLTLSPLSLTRTRFIATIMVTTRRSAGSSMEPTATGSTARQPQNLSPPRNPPLLPTPTERLLLAVFPLVLIFGTLFSVLSPETRSAHYDHVTQSHSQDPSAAPSYFARKSNIFNVVFVKRGWGWTTFAFYFFLFTHPSGGAGGLDITPRRLRAVLRWAAVTAWWFLVTQWCFGPPMIDRGFRWTGGKCDMAERDVLQGSADIGEAFTAVACKAAGGKWNGGHDISGHVFLLVLGTCFLAQEIGWAVSRWSSRLAEERCIVLPDGAVKSANVEAETAAGQGGGYALGIGTRTALGVVGLNLWMLLMTAIYFHTWFEKVCRQFCKTKWMRLTIDSLPDY